MCVIVHLPAGKKLSTEVLKACYDTNSHGWGIIAAIGGELLYDKDVTPFEDFLDAWSQFPDDVERAVHFRIRTHGETNKDNCHPFFPSEEIGIMHNGMIDTTLVDAGMSDTHNFVKYEMSNILKGWQDAKTDFMEDPVFVKLVEKLTGHSRLLFMTKDGRVLKSRTKDWVTRDGCDFSNGNSFYKLNTYIGGTGLFHARNTYTPSKTTYSHNYDDYEDTDLGVSSVNSQLSSYNKTKFKDQDVQLLWQDELNKTTPPDSKKTGELIVLNKKEEGPVTNKYKVLKLEQQKDPVSDLYAGNKTDAEGQDYLDALEEERKKELEQAEYVVNANPIKADVVIDGDMYSAAERNDDEEEEDDDEPTEEYAITINQALLMSDDELAEWCEYCPTYAHQLINQLLEHCINSGTIDIPHEDSTPAREEAPTDKKLAVNN